MRDRLLTLTLLAALAAAAPVRADLNFQAESQADLTAALAELRTIELARRGGSFGSGIWWPWGIRCADLDKDGKPEVYLNFHSTVGSMLFWNKTPAGGPLTFQRDTQFDVAPTPTDPSGWGNRKLPLENPPLFLDLNNDTWLDVVSMGDESGHKRGNLKNVAGGLSLWGLGPSFGYGTIAEFSVPPDGLPDLWIRRREYGVTREFRRLATGSGTWTSANVGVLPWPDGLPAAVANRLTPLVNLVNTSNKSGGPLFYPCDLNGDGREDLVVKYGNAYTESPTYRWVMYCLRDENGVLQDATAGFPVPATLDILVGDYNGDGRTDLLANGSTNGSGLYLQQPGGVWVNASPKNAAGTGISDFVKTQLSYGYTIRPVDLDKDGDLDLVISNMRSRGGRVYENKGAGATPQYVRYLAFRHFDADGFDLVDLDADGDLDLLVGGQPDDTQILVYRNLTPPPAPPPPPPKPTGTVSGPATGLIGETLTFTAEVTGTGELSYAWDFGDGSLGQGNPASHAYQAAGDFTVALTVTDPLGQSGNGVWPVTVAEPGPARGSRLPLPSTDQGTPAFARLKAMGDAGNAGRTSLAYLYRVTKEKKYGDAAVAGHRAYLDAADAKVAAGQTPAIHRDQYLYCGAELASLAAVYDWCHDLLPPDLKARTEAFAAQALWNVWHPQDMHWGDRTYTRGGVGLTKVVDNYHYSFLRATTAWALAKNDEALLNLLATDKLPAAVAGHAAYPEGGGPEGTGYSPASRYFFEVLRWWKEAGRGDLAAQNPHVRKWLDYWVHATTPDGKKFAPFGDQARESTGTQYDYHRQNLLEAVRLSPGTPEADRGRWWLAGFFPRMTRDENAFYDLLDAPGPAAAPTETFYAAPAVGHYFWRTGWGPDARFLALSAGSLKTDHDHGDKGSFFLWAFGRWQVVTANTWNAGGIKDLPDLQPAVRFVGADGTALKQRWNVAPAVAVSGTPARFSAALDLGALYNPASAGPVGWTRTLTFDGRVLSLTDATVCPPGVTPVWQLQLTDEPTLAGPAAAGTPDLTVWLDAALAKESWKDSTIDPGKWSGGWRLSGGGSTTYDARLILRQ